MKIRKISSYPNYKLDGDVYSTEEIKVGKWINNKNIYRRVFVGTLNGLTSNTWNNLMLLENIDEIVTIDGTIKNTLTDLRTLNLNTYEDENYNSSFSYLESTGYVQVKINGWNSEEYKFIYKLILEYTKVNE